MFPLENSNSYVIRQVPKKGTDSWRAARSSCICASEVSGLLGLDTTHSRKRIMDEKLGIRPSKKETPFVESMMNWGHALEDVALAQVSKNFITPVVRFGSLLHRKYRQLQGEPDGITAPINDDAWVPIEIKTRCWPTPYEAVPYETEWDIPSKHWVQLQIYMELLDSKWGILYNYTINNGSTGYWIPRDEFFFNNWVVPLIHDFESGELARKLRVPSKFKAEVEQYIQDAREYIIPIFSEYI